jgi:acylphosphatase
VQGVFFRKYIEEHANKIGIRGFVRNLEDGRVEVVIEGRDDKVQEMVKFCQNGPPHSQIKNVEINEIKYQGFQGFKISRL